VTLREALNNVESGAFAVRMNAASDLATFQRRSAREPAVLTLASCVLDRRAALTVLHAALQLTGERGDFRFEHPHDTALAVYVLVLAGAHPELARVLAEHALSVPRLWWAQRIARTILLGEMWGTDEKAKHFVLGLPIAGPGIDHSSIGVRAQRIVTGLFRPEPRTQSLELTAEPDRRSSSANRREPHLPGERHGSACHHYEVPSVPP
jgi:hypothetical protein